ncbi:restriction endonuclease [Bifidobacterium pseudolongum subsp. globosum]|uniref:Restriction endonuclease n=1 Tax=Bifidobacterium pseudolongum subsp. globosum TaxID=1690 RepID=A0A4Q5AT04_9BIFI|nr:restriction endonuclease subunit S [Bifidobacterium pseudolongum]MCH4852316.1 restriction endonuclease subunit S [Bifidobacterium pseudolongum]RYQ36251.1 restriction endonuclease [Bifidobacterium pseudolongum subsp. globosum]
MRQLMKDSGIEWIGKIPSDWNTIALKRTVRLQTGRTPTTTKPFYFNGNVNWYTPGDLTNNICKTAKRTIAIQALADGEAVSLPESAILVCCIGGSIGKCGYMGNAGSCNQQITALIANDNVSSKYIFYCLLASGDDFAKQALYTTMPIATNSYLGSRSIPLPSFREQVAIADYLDDICSKISNIETLIKEQIDSLEQYRRSVIHEAVTRGLNPDTPMKDSGTVWLGQVPQSWTVTPVKYLASIKDSMASRKLTAQVEYLGMENIESWTGHLVGLDSRPSEVSSSVSGFSKSSVLFGKLRPYLAKVAKPDFDGVCSTELLVLEPKGINREYLFWSLLNQELIDMLTMQSSGVKMPRVSWNQLGNAQIAVPSGGEQCQIASYLDRKCADIDSIIDVKKQQLETLSEYKKSLIYEYVTGKREVPA